jgi:hypothetical protein
MEPMLMLNSDHTSACSELTETVNTDVVGLSVLNPLHPQNLGRCPRLICGRSVAPLVPRRP